MSKISDKSSTSEYTKGKNKFIVLELKDSEFQSLVDSLVSVMPSYYISQSSVADTLKKLGKTVAAEKVRVRVPEAKKIRSGDIGEVLASEYIKGEIGYSVPIKKLRWRDHKNMPMRGDDVIGLSFNLERQSIKFIKAEAKASGKLSRSLFEKARAELDMDEGFPAPHALSFVSERLREIGTSDLADLIEKVQLQIGIKAKDVKHLLFTFTESNPATLQKEEFDNYAGGIEQVSVGFKVKRYTDVVTSVYEGVLDGIDNIGN